MLGFICPGKVNPFPRSLHFEYYNLTLYLIYASGSRLIISTWDNQIIQTIELSGDPQDKITSVSLSKYNGKIAIGFKTFVKIFSPHTSNFKEISWEFDSFITYDDHVTSISWFLEDELLVSGSTISTWKFSDKNWSCSWSESSTSEIYISEISPDCNWVASSQNHGCYLKMWPRIRVSAESLHQAYSFIRHPSPVVNFGWQQIPSQNGLQILYTACTDGIFRAWAASNPKQPEQFYLCCAVEPSPLTTNPEFMESDNSSKSPMLQRIEDHDLYYSAPFHWIDGSIVRELAKKEIGHCSLKNLNSELNSRDSSMLDHLKAIVLNPPVLIFQIQFDGGLSLWKLDGMNGFPFATPKVLAIARIPNAVKSKEYSSFFGTCYTAKCPISDFLLDSPIEFSIITQNADLEIDHYTLGLLQALFSDQKGGEFKLRTTWTGHESKIRIILASPAKNNILKSQSCESIPYSRVLSMGEQGEIGIWDTKYSSDRLHPFCQVDMLLQDKELIRDVAWLTSDYLIVIESSRCYMYHIQGGAINSGQVYLLNAKDSFSELSKIIIIPDSEQKNFGVIVLNKALDFFHLWHVCLGDSNVPEIQYLTTKELPFGFGLNSGWLINSLSYPKKGFLISDLFYVIISHESNVQFWKPKISLSPNFEFEWVKENVFSTFHSSIDNISCGPGNLILVASFLNNISLVSILDTRFIAFGIINEYEVEWCGDSITNTCWMPSNLGTPILGVSSKTSIQIFYQDITTNSKKWTLRSNISIDSLKKNSKTLELDDIDSICIAPDGSLYFSSGKYFTCCGKWLSESETISCDIKKEYFPAPTFHSICQFSRPYIPCIHPDFLFEILKWGDISLLDTMFVHLEDTITHQDIISNSSSIVVPPVSLDNFIYQKSEKNSKSESGLEALFSLGNDYHRSLSDYQVSAMCDALIQCPIEGLESSAQKLLIDFIRVFYKIKRMQNSVDAFGFRFLIDSRFQAIFNEPIHSTSSSIGKCTLNSYSFLYALHSNSQDILMSECSSEYKDIIQKSDVSAWKELSKLGIAYWLQDDNALRREAENLARAQFLKNKDPVECTLIYSALNKKRLLLSLWKTATYHKEHEVMVKFLSNDFSLDRWKTAAQKNAFKLIGRQRYEYATAFFILGGQLKDAVGVCLRYLKDPSLALFICRCYEGAHSEVSQRLMKETILPATLKLGDRGLTSIILWWLDEKKLAIQALSLSVTSISKIFEEKYQIKDFGESMPSLPKYLDFKNVAINIRQEKVFIESEDQRKLLLNTLMHYEELGMPILSLYSLSHLNIELDLSENKDADSLKAGSGDFHSHDLTSKFFVTTDIFNDSSNSTTKVSNDIPLNNSQSAISSGQIDFDDWSWGLTPIRKAENSKLFDIPDVPDTIDISSSCSLNLGTDQFNLIRGYTYSLLHLLHREVEDSLTSSQHPRRLPKTIVFDYLDKVKAGIQKIYSFFEFDEQSFDSSLVKWCLDTDNALLGFDLLYQGILSQEINGQQFVNTLTANCLYLSSVILKDNNKACDTESSLSWIKSIFRDYDRWSVALRLTSDSTQANFQLQIIVFVMIIIYLFYLVKARDFKNLLSLLNNWNQIILALEEDLETIQSIIKLILEEEYKKHPINFDTNQTWDLNFEIGDDLKIVYTDKDNQKSALNIEEGCESLIQEVNLFNELISFILPSIKHFLIIHIHEPNASSYLPSLTATLLEPILHLRKSIGDIINSISSNESSSDLNEQQLPETFQVGPDKVFDSFHQATYFTYIRRFLKDPSNHNFVNQQIEN